MAQNNTIKSAGKFGKRASNLLGLIHSAVDINDGGHLYEFAQWLNTSEFTGEDPMGG